MFLFFCCFFFFFAKKKKKKKKKIHWLPIRSIFYWPAILYPDSKEISIFMPMQNPHYCGMPRTWSDCVCSQIRRQQQKYTAIISACNYTWQRPRQTTRQIRITVAVFWLRGWIHLVKVLPSRETLCFYAHQPPSKNGLNGKNLHPSRFFPVRANPFSEGKQNVFGTVSSLEKYILSPKKIVMSLCAHAWATQYCVFYWLRILLV